MVLWAGIVHADDVVAALDDLLPPVQTETEQVLPAEETEEESEDSGQNDEKTGEDKDAKEVDEEEVDEEEEPEPEPEPVKPEIEAPDEPLVSTLPTPQTADIQQQIQKLREALDNRQHVLDLSEQRLAFAESLLARLDNEYESFELRLEKAGLNLTDDYANLLRQRLDRLRSQTIASGLTQGISAQLSAAREEQLRLEEFEAVIEPDDEALGRMEAKRTQLLRQLHTTVTKHIEVLNEYYSVVIKLLRRLEQYQELLQQRLFWLPSTEAVDSSHLGDLYRGATWFISSLKWKSIKRAVERSMEERWPLIFLFIIILGWLWVRRRKIRRALIASGHPVGNVRQDRWQLTFWALLLSLLLALPGVILLGLAHLLLESGNSFLNALSRGFFNAAISALLLRGVYTVAYTKGLGERHFQWNKNTLTALRKYIPVLLAVLIPILIIMPTMNTTKGSPYSDSLGRLLFAIASIALAYFAQKFMSAVRKDQPGSRTLILVHIASVATPLILTVVSLWGYHYTAVQFEGLIFISICWVALVILIHYLGLRGLAVRERRIALKQAIEQREAERKHAEHREAAEISGDGLPPMLESPQRDIHDISQQSEALLKIVSVILAGVGLFMLWENIFPALKIFDEVTLWTIQTGAEGEPPIPINLWDVMLALGIGVATFLAARNLPGTLEITMLSRMNLEPGVGYAITTLATYIIVFIGIAATLAGLGFQWSKLQWLVAALGVGLGFGLQEIVANFVSGIILLFERPIRVGDTVSIGGITGTVSRIRIRATTLVDWDRKEQIIPNKSFVTQDLTNWTLSDPITRLIVRVGVAYGSDVDKVQDLLQQVAVENERVVDDPAPAVFCVELGESSIDFEIRAFVRDILDLMPLSHELHSAITRILRANDIEIPFPQRDIHIRSEFAPRGPAE
ncbi:mechanosensitive ion channel domain-containing protein [Marinobacter sp. F4216]|uniref:mechanosensitive ion channel domain-containing protein n=1 Tax=Marinobacter sp. F4216 TaxID=2874281 RepID=UPI001CBF5A9C|nr:mechanosensitive ion channel domain-containing protein [Marinobacter sp. F4216]MBZ2168061.1 mechanosensitive ion channel [Marinobacter sp. F4216]